MNAEEARIRTENVIINIEQEVERKFKLFKESIMQKISKATDIGDFYVIVDSIYYDEEESEAFQLVIDQNIKYDVKNELELLGYHIEYYDESIRIGWYPNK